MALIDTHCHLAFSSYDEDRATVIRRAKSQDVAACIVVAVDVASAEAGLRLAQAEPGWAFATAGLHPTETSTMSERAHDAIRALLETRCFVAVGETGLDAYHTTVPMDIQVVSLHRHLSLAVEFDLPVILHCRDAFERIHSELRAWRGRGVRGVLHCFTGTPSDVSNLAEFGLHVGIGGVATFPRNHSLREALRSVPHDRLLLETDAPWLAPVPVRGQRNEPAHVSHVATSVANTIGIDVNDLAALTTLNARSLFRLDSMTARQATRPHVA